MIGNLIVMGCCIWLGYYLGSSKSAPADTQESVNEFLEEFRK